MSDTIAAATAPPPVAPPPSTWASVPYRYLQPGEIGYNPDPNNPASVTLSPADWAAMMAGQGSPAAGAQPQPGDPAITVSAGAATPSAAPAPPPAPAPTSAAPSAVPADVTPAPPVPPSGSWLGPSSAAAAEVKELSDAEVFGTAAPVPAKGELSDAEVFGTPPPPDPRLTGYGANLAAGGNAAIAGTLGGPVDLLTGGINLATRGINAATGTTIPPIVDPVGGSGTFKRMMGATGLIPHVWSANPDDVRADGVGQEIARGVGGGLVSAAMPAGVVSGLVRGGAMAAETAPRVLSALGDASPQNFLLSGASGGGAEAAASQVPDKWKPEAGLAGGLAAGGIPAVGTALARWGGRAVGHFFDTAFGRVNPILDASGAPPAMADGTPINMLTPDAETGKSDRPLAAKNSVARRAGLRLRKIADDPDAVRAALAEQGPPALPGNPTTPQLTRDAGLLAAERGISRVAPDAQGPFLKQASGENDTRVRLIHGIAPGADPAALSAEVHARAAAQDAEAADRAAKAQDAASRSVNALPADHPAGSEAAIGAALRAPAAAAEAAAHDVRGALYDAVDPGDKLALSTSPIRRGGAAIAGDMSVNDADVGAKEAAIFRKVAALPDVQKFKDIRALRKTITNQIRKERGPDGDPEAGRRLSMLLGHVEGVLNDAIKDGEIAPATPGAVARPAGASVAKPDVGTKVYTPSGKAAEVRYVIREARDLVTSQLPDGRNNPAYLHELQPRDRERAASLLQGNRMANDLHPEEVGASASTATGAPISGADGQVESGNQRAWAIKEAYRLGKAGSYRQALADSGYDISGFDEPALTRERVAPAGETMAERAAWAKEAGAPTTLALSTTERAAGDAGLLSGDLLRQLQPGEIGDSANRPFVRSFLRDVVEPGQEGSFVTRDGDLSKEGAARVEAALVHRAYGDEGLTAALTETTDPTARVLAGALQDAAGPMARLKAGIEAGTVDPALDLAPALVEATRVVQQARSKGISLADAVAQQDAFSALSPKALSVLQTAYGENLSGRMSRSLMGTTLEDYARAAEQRGVAADMFGDNVTAQQLLESVSSRNGTNPSTGQAGSASAVSTGLGSGPGQRGSEARESGSGSPGQAAPGGGGGGQSGARVLPNETLTPNLDAGGVERLRVANAQNVADRARFNDAPGVGEMLQGGPTKGTFLHRDSAVPGLIVRTGAIGRDVAQAYLAAGGDPEKLADAAAYSLRQVAVKDGVFNEKAYDAWADKRGPFLSTVPELAAKFRNAAAAQRTVNEASAAQAASVKARQASVLGKFTPGADPVAVVGSILGDKTMGRAHMAQLVDAVKGNPDALAGLRRAIALHMVDSLIGNKTGAGGLLKTIKGDQVQSFVKLREPALAEALSPQEMASLHNLADSLERSDLSGSGSKMAGGSDTEQIKAAGSFMGSITKSIKSGGSTAVGAVLGFIFGGGVLGAMVGGSIGKAGERVYEAIQVAHEAGIMTENDLVANAILHPQLYAVLDAKVTAQNREALGRALISQLRRISLVSSAVGYQAQQGGNQPPANALLH